MSTNVVDCASEDSWETVVSLSPTEIHLWLAFYDERSEEPLNSAYRELLNGEERRQEPKFYFARDRQRYLVTRALVRTVLSRYVDIPPKEWEFSSNAYGRPEIANAQGREACLVFNISHTHSLIVLGVTKHRALGVDVENLSGREVSIAIADRYFAAQEVAELKAAPVHQQEYRFFEYWTLKEAYIKARGMGLSLPLDKFSFRYPDEHTVEMTIDPEFGGDALRWQFWQFRPTPEYLVAICAEHVGAGSPELIVRQVIPMLSEKQCALDVLRASPSAQ
jgi:4'-phosphopantetheinyl transferase